MDGDILDAHILVGFTPSKTQIFHKIQYQRVFAGWIGILFLVGKAPLVGIAAFNGWHWIQADVDLNRVDPPLT